MKRLSSVTALMIFVCCTATLSCQNGQRPANRPIFGDGGTIPDSVFRAYVLQNFDTDRNALHRGQKPEKEVTGNIVS